MESDSERYSRILRRWADELAIPSGDFVNVDLRVAADQIDRLRAELAKFDGMVPVPAEDANDLDDVVRELGIEDSFTTPADAVRELKAAKDARIAELEAAGNRLGDAAITGILDGNDFRARAERAEAELDISREAHRMVQSALLSQAAETERAEAERDAMREALRKIERETIDYVAAHIARAALNTPP